MPYPNSEVPILMLHTMGQEYSTPERSWTNDVHNEAAFRIISKFIAERLPSADITILCYYSAAAKRIAAMGPPSQVYTVNRYQGRECDIAIIVTTRISVKNVYKNTDFILDPLRATVALSRAKEGIVIIGDQSLLIQSPLWKTYLERYSECMATIQQFFK